MYSLLPNLAEMPFQVTTDQIVRIAFFVVILIVVWIVLRMLLRITFRFFSFGCAAIVILGLVLLFIRFFQR
jgi:hypothetical protein